MSGRFIGAKNPWETEDTREDETTKRILAKRGLDSVRVDLRSQGYEVEALDKPKQQQKSEHRQTQQQAQEQGFGLDLASHPLVQPGAGQIDRIIIPEGELSKDLSAQTQREQHKHKLKQRMEMANKLQQKQKQRYTYQPKSRPTPKPTPM